MWREMYIYIYYRKDKVEGVQECVAFFFFSLHNCSIKKRKGFHFLKRYDLVSTLNARVPFHVILS
jgi:hypothetical protein